MAKEKKSAAEKPAKKAATKKSAKAAKNNPVAEQIAATPPAQSVEIAHTRPKPPSPADLYDEIRRRAYEFYCARGGQHGSHEADWHRAESEVRAKYK